MSKSETDLGELTARVQELTGVEVDRVWGPVTARAVLAKINAQRSTSNAQRPMAEGPSGNNPSTASAMAVGARSARNIATLLPWVQPVATQFLETLASAGIRAAIISGTRTYEEQDALYGQGRSMSGKVVTNARGGYSNHNFGIAFDIGIFTADGKYLEESLLYDKAGLLGKGLGLSWGGDWAQFQDKPHFELRPAWGKDLPESALIAGMRMRVGKGEALV